MLLFLLLVAHAASVAIVNHMAGRTGARTVPPTHQTLMLTLKRVTPLAADAHAAFLRALVEAAEHDHCTLTFSSSASQNTLLYHKLHCPPPPDDGVIGVRDIATTATLEAVIEAHGYTLAGREQLRDYTTPSAARPRRNVTALFRGEPSDPRQWRRMPRGDFSADYVESPAPWGLARIDYRYGPLTYRYAYAYLGAGVDLYVVDTGIRVTHAEFGGRAQFLVNTVGDGINTDCAGHGTMVASLAGGAQFGAAKGVSLYAVKVLDCAGDGDTFTIATGVAAILEQVQTTRRPSIASLSLGGSRSATLDAAVLSLLAANVTVVVAAGNDQADACHYSPSDLGGSSAVLTVAASSERDTRPVWSNYGACVSLSAPGADIVGAYYTSDTATVVMSGTSMATPFASGVAALVLEQAPALSPARVKAELQAWATPAVVAGASASGGGRALLYALIVESVPIPPFATPGGGGGGGDGGGGDYEDVVGGGARLAPSLLLLALVVVFHAQVTRSAPQARGAE